MTHPAQAPRNNYPQHQPEWSRAAQTPPIVYGPPQPQYGYNYAPQQAYAPQPYAAQQLSHYAMAPQYPPAWAAQGAAEMGRPNPNRKSLLDKLKEHKVAGITTAASLIGSVVAATVIGNSIDSKQAPRITSYNDDGTITTSESTNPGALEVDPTTGYLNVSSLDKNGDGLMSEDELNALPSPDMAQQIDPSQLVAAYGSEEFDQWRRDSFDKVNPTLTTEQASALNESSFPSGPIESWDNQRIFNSISLGKSLAMGQSSKDLGRQMLPTIVDPRVDEYQSLYDQTGSGVVLDVYKASGVPYPKPHGSFMGITDLTENAKIMHGTYEHNGTGDDAQFPPGVGMLVDLVKSPDGKSAVWRELGVWSDNDQNFIQATIALQ